MLRFLSVRKLLMAVRYHFELWNFPAWFPEHIQQRFPEVRVVHLNGYEGLDQEIEDAEIFVGWSLRPAQLARARKLRWIHSTAAGVAQLCYPELVASPVILTNASPVMAGPVAEHTLALILALARHIPSAVRYQEQAVWAQSRIWEEKPRPMELEGTTLGLIGLGHIGRELATRARSFGMRVIAVKRDPSRGGECANRVFPPQDLDQMLKESDFVTVVAPETPATRHLIGAAALAAMKPTAYLINVSRGTLVDEAALVEALQAGRIAGAALDVAEREPLPPESSLWRAPNLLITPHLAASSERLWQRHAELLEDNVRRYLTGEPLRNVVNKAAGY